MMYLLDTVSLVRYLSGSQNIGKKAEKIFKYFEQSDDEFAVSAISLMEIMYLAEKNRINIQLKETVEMLRNTAGYKIINLNPEIVLTAAEVDFYELHDRMILASAKWLAIPIISSDKKFKQVPDIEVIWD